MNTILLIKDSDGKETNNEKKELHTKAEEEDLKNINYIKEDEKYTLESKYILFQPRKKRFNILIDNERTYMKTALKTSEK